MGPVFLCYAISNTKTSMNTGIWIPGIPYISMHPQKVYTDNLVKQGPVVQSVVSLTSSLRVISLTVLAGSIYNILIFFAVKM